VTKPLPVSAETDTAAEEADVDADIEEVVERTQDSQELNRPTEGAAEDGAHDGARESTPEATRRIWSRVLAYGVLPGLALLLALAAGFLKWQGSSVRDAGLGRVEAIQAAREATVALLSYRPDTAERDLGAARDRLTGHFKDDYTSLTRDLVIPGSKQKQISAVATVQGAASVSAQPNHGVVLLFVNQTTTVGTGAPASTASSVRVTLDKIDGRWLISGFDPV
jgi:Mce-associated membrane protein